MTPAQALSIETIWQQWERRIVNARFPLLQYLGGSRYSAFYLTEISGAKAAIKLIPAGTSRASAQVACWKTAARLSHPHLVKILEAGLWHADEEQDMYFAVMERCDESLADLLRERRLTPAEARDVLSPTLGVLKYLHGQGLLHGQIKPAHLLACGDQLKLSCDTIHRNGEGHPSAIESPYDAPEKAAGTISLSGDVWSLGITLFESLTGHLPGAGRNGDAKAAEKLPAPFDAIVAGCLARERDKRLSLSAIRALLDKAPSTDATQDGRLATKESSRLIVLPSSTPASSEPAASKMEVIKPSSPPEKPAAAAPLRPNTDRVTQVARQHRFLLIALAILAVLAILIGPRMKRSGTAASAPAKAAAVAHPSALAAEPASTPAAVPAANRPAAVLHQVLPTIAEHAQKTIHGTVKVKVLVNVGSDGRVIHSKLAVRGPSEYFAQQALDASRQWSFAAPVRNGTAEMSKWALHYEFRRSGATVTARQFSAD